LFVGGCAGIPDVPAPDNPTLNDRFYLAGGGFYTKVSTQARLDSASLGVGATLDLEESFDLDENLLVPFAMSHLRMDDRWRLELEYFRVKRESNATIDVEIQWGDQLFPVDTGLDALFDIAVLRASLGYAFFRRKDKELGIALGAHVARIEAALEDGAGNGDEGELLAPLPVGSLYAGIALTETFSVNMRFDAFSLDYEEYSGRVLSTGVDMIWQPFRHVGMGVGYRNLLVDLEMDDGEFSGMVDSDFRGPIAFLNVSF